MNRWKKFLQRRRQNDAVKLALVFLLAGIVCMGGVWYNGMKLYEMLSVHTEYVLTVPGAAGTSDIRIKLTRLLELSESGEFGAWNRSDILAVSLQQYKSVTAMYRGQEVPISYMELSEEYLDKVYGIRREGSMRTFYLNQKAWNTFGGSKSELLLSCLADDTQEAGKCFNRTARFVLMAEQMPQEEPLIFAMEEQGSLAQCADSIRICFKQQGAEDRRIEILRNQGFDFEDGEALVHSAYRKKLLQERMKYVTVIGVFCFLDMGILWKYSKYRRPAGNGRNNSKERNEWQ